MSYFPRHKQSRNFCLFCDSESYRRPYDDEIPDFGLISKDKPTQFYVCGYCERVKLRELSTTDEQDK